MSTETSVAAIIAKFPDTSAKDWRRRAKYTMYNDEARVFENIKSKAFCTVYELGNATVVKEGNMFPATDPELMKRLIKAGNTIKHCGDYCNMYWNPTDQTVWMCMGDGDCPMTIEEGMQPATTYDELKQSLLDAGAKVVLIEAEHSPSWDEALGMEMEPFDNGWTKEDDSDDHAAWWKYYHVGAVKGIAMELDW